MFQININVRKQYGTLHIIFTKFWHTPARKFANYACCTPNIKNTVLIVFFFSSFEIKQTENFLTIRGIFKAITKTSGPFPLRWRSVRSWFGVLITKTHFRDGKIRYQHEEDDNYRALYYYYICTIVPNGEFTSYTAKLHRLPLTLWEALSLSLSPEDFVRVWSLIING